MINDLTPTRQAVAAKERSGKLTVSGKLKTAIDLMLFEGSRRPDAAAAAGMTDHGLREAFKNHRRAFELIERLADEHGDRSGLKVYKGRDTEDLVEQVVKTLQSASEANEAIAVLAEQVRAAKVPFGFLAGVVKRCYATLVLKRAVGLLVAGSPIEDECDLEAGLARTHFNRQVIIDTSTVVTLTCLSDYRRLTGVFL